MKREQIAHWVRSSASHLAAVALGIALVVGISTAAAQYLKIDKTAWTSITNLTASAINSAVWTGWLPVIERESVVFEIDYTYSAGTDISMTCETADANATTGAMPANGSGFELHKLQDSATAGTSDSYPHIWRETSGASGLWTWTVGNLPHNRINCSFVATGGDANNKVTVRWRAISP